MQQQGFRPDACVYNVVLEALVSSGLVSAQAKAVQLCAAAVSGGRAGRGAVGGRCCCCCHQAWAVLLCRVGSALGQATCAAAHADA